MVRRIVRKKIPRQRFDLVDEIIAFESGTITPTREKRLFQDLVNSGQAFKLQGFFGRRAQAMIKAGIIKPRKRKK